MNDEFKAAVKAKLRETLGRDPKVEEVANLGNDALLLARVLTEKVANLETRIKKLEKIIS